MSVSRSLLPVMREFPQRLARTLANGLARFRTLLLTRIEEVNAMTEREVVAAAESLSKVVETATAQANRTKAALSLVATDDQGVTGAIARQTQTVRRFNEHVSLAVAEQQSSAERAAEHLQQIGHAAKAVSSLAREARMLAVNARIEAARLGAAGASFEVIADEMQRLSSQITKTNELIDQLTVGLARTVEGVANGAVSLRTKSDLLSAELSKNIADVEREVGELQSAVQNTLTASDEDMRTILSASAAALSHLQFQDAVAQGLLRIDAWIWELQLDQAERMGLGQIQHLIPVPTHTEIGGDKAVDNANSGEVRLF